MVNTCSKESSFSYIGRDKHFKGHPMLSVGKGEILSWKIRFLVML